MLRSSVRLPSISLTGFFCTPGDADKARSGWPTISTRGLPRIVNQAAGCAEASSAETRAEREIFRLKRELQRFDVEDLEQAKGRTPSRALVGTCSSVTVLPEDAWSRVKPVRQIGQAVFPRSYRHRRLLLLVFRDMPGHAGLSAVCSRRGGWMPAGKPSILS